MMPGPLTRPPRLEGLRSVPRLIAGVSAAALVAFHGFLFAAQVAEGGLDDPWLVARWLIAAALVGALTAIRRAGGSIWTRQGLAVWVLAAMLHGPAVATEFGHSFNSLALPETSATSVLESLLSVSVLAGALWILAGLLALRDRHSRFYAGCCVASFIAIFGDGFSPRYFSRPPPRLN